MFAEPNDIVAFTMLNSLMIANETWQYYYYEGDKPDEIAIIPCIMLMERFSNKDNEVVYFDNETLYKVLRWRHYDRLKMEIGANFLAEFVRYHAMIMLGQ